MIRIIGAIVAVVLALAGGFALFLYVQNADQRAAAGQKLESVYVLKDEVPKGTSGIDVKDHLEVEKLPAVSIQPDIVTSLSSIAGLVTNADLLKGEQLVRPRFSTPQELAQGGTIEIPKGLQEITVPLAVSRVVGGEVKAGDTVGILYTSNTNSDASNAQVAFTQFVYDHVLVTRVVSGLTYQASSSGIGTNGSSSSTSSSSNASSAQSPIAMMVTLAVSTAEAEKIAYGAEQQEDNNGGIWLTLQNSATDTGGSALRNGGNIFQ